LILKIRDGSGKQTGGSEIGLRLSLCDEFSLFLFQTGFVSSQKCPRRFFGKRLVSAMPLRHSPDRIPLCAGHHQVASREINSKAMAPFSLATSALACALKRANGECGMPSSGVPSNAATILPLMLDLYNRHISARSTRCRNRQKQRRFPNLGIRRKRSGFEIRLIGECHFAARRRLRNVKLKLFPAPISTPVTNGKVCIKFAFLLSACH
jgi:hypothetical protein